MNLGNSEPQESVWVEGKLQTNQQVLVDSEVLRIRERGKRDVAEIRARRGSVYEDTVIGLSCVFEEKPISATLLSSFSLTLSL